MQSITSNECEGDDTKELTEDSGNRTGSVEVFWEAAKRLYKTSLGSRIMTLPARPSKEAEKAIRGERSKIESWLLHCMLPGTRNTIPHRLLSRKVWTHISKWRKPENWLEIWRRWRKRLSPWMLLSSSIYRSEYFGKELDQQTSRSLAHLMHSKKIWQTHWEI